MDELEFIEALKDLGINIEEKQLSNLKTYYEMLIEYNAHTNLTRITDKKDVYLKHFYDSLTIVKSIKLSNQSLLDIGTGAGFPGLVLKIVFPDLKVTLVDALNKRVVFLNSVIEKLNLKKVEVVHQRAEEYALNNRESFDIVVSRAVANLNVLSELCIPLVKESGYFIAMKADSSSEVKGALKAIETLGGVITDTVMFELPFASGIRTLIKIKKIHKTNVKYPRKFSEIKKKPL